MLSMRRPRVGSGDLIVALRITLASVALGLVVLYTMNSTTHGAAVDHFETANALVKQALLGSVVAAAAAGEVETRSAKAEGDVKTMLAEGYGVEIPIPATQQRPPIVPSLHQ